MTRQHAKHASDRLDNSERYSMAMPYWQQRWSRRTRVNEILHCAGVGGVGVCVGATRIQGERKGKRREGKVYANRLILLHTEYHVIGAYTSS